MLPFSLTIPFSVNLSNISTDRKLVLTSSTLTLLGLAAFYLKLLNELWINHSSIIKAYIYPT